MATKERSKLVLNRDYVLTTMKGHSIEFKKGVPTHVPNIVYAEAIAIGAMPDDGSDPDLLKDEHKDKAPADPAERQPMIIEAIKAIVARNDRVDFMASGQPTVAAVTSEVDFKVQAKEVATAWQAYHDEKAE